MATVQGPTGIDTLLLPSNASTDKAVKIGSQVLVDYKQNDYRGFAFVVHDTHGLLLLQCSRKKKKPVHYQIPGGHVDEPEFIGAAKLTNDRNAQLELAGKVGAARELFEETGIDIRSSLDRLEPAALRNGTKLDKDGHEILPNEYKHRYDNSCMNLSSNSRRNTL